MGCASPCRTGYPHTALGRCGARFLLLQDRAAGSNGAKYRLLAAATGIALHSLAIAPFRAEDGHGFPPDAFGLCTIQAN